MKKNLIKFLPTSRRALLVFIFIVITLTFIVLWLASIKAPFKNLSFSIIDSIKGNKSISFQFGSGESGGAGASGTY